MDKKQLQVGLKQFKRLKFVHKEKGQTTGWLKQPQNHPEKVQCHK